MKTFYCVFNLIKPQLEVPLHKSKLLRENSLNKFSKKYQIKQYLGAVIAKGNIYHLYEVHNEFSKYFPLENISNTELLSVLTTFMTYL